jgi:hypothetical protein
MERVQVACDEVAGRLRLERGGLRVACNLAERVRRIPLERHAEGRVLLASLPPIETSADGISLRAAWRLGGHSGMAVTRSRGRPCACLAWAGARPAPTPRD